MRTRTSLLLTAVGALVACCPATAGAELVRLQNGRVLSVTACRFEGETAVILLRDGGEIRTPRSFVIDVQPDEVPYIPPASLIEAVLPLVAAQVLPAEAGDLRALVGRLAAEYGVDPQLAHAVVLVESNYQPRAVSSKGAMGLMQLMPDTARQYALEDPFDPVQNLTAGLRHLRGLLDKFGTAKTELALAAYNAGVGAVSRYNGIPPYRETQNYVRRILTLAQR